MLFLSWHHLHMEYVPKKPPIFYEYNLVIKELTFESLQAVGHPPSTEYTLEAALEKEPSMGGGDGAKDSITLTQPDLARSNFIVTPLFTGNEVTDDSGR